MKSRLIRKDDIRIVMEGRLTGVLISSSVPSWLLNNGGSVSSALRRPNTKCSLLHTRNTFFSPLNCNR